MAPDHVTATDESPLVIRLADTGPLDAPQVGVKALGLGTLMRSGFPVPDGFCLTTSAMRLFIKDGGLEARLDEIAKRCSGAGLDAKESWAFLGETRKRIAETTMPTRLRDAIASAYEALGGRVVAVRSSGTKEDLEDASFAGQYESFLNVRGVAFVEDAIRKCWASVWRNRVLRYSGAQQQSAHDLGLGVLVQVLVKARAAGVLFTLNPTTGRDEEMVIEATVGLGETLVSGKVNPDRYVVERRTGHVLRAEVVEKDVRLRAASSHDGDGIAYEGATATPEAVPEADRGRAAITEDELRSLACLGQRVQEHYGRPMDLEWAIDLEGAWLLQARPITHLGFAPDLGEWTNANFKDGGVASDVCSAFMASLYDRIFSQTMPTWFRTLRILRDERAIDWLRVFYGRPYWNVGEVKRLLLDLPGFVERDFDEDLGLERPYEGDGRRTPITLVGLVRAIPILLAVRRAYRERLSIAKEFVKPFLERYAELDGVDLDGMPRDELLRRYRELIERTYVETESTYFLTVYALSNSKIDFKVVFDKVNRAAAGALSYLDLIVGLRDVAHLRPQKELHCVVRDALASGREPDLTGFLERWKHHSTRELDLTVPRWIEDPTFVRETAHKVGAADVEDPQIVEDRQVARYETEKARVRTILRRPRFLVRPLLRWAFQAGLRRIREYAWWREELRDCSMRCYWLVRKWTLAVGRRLVSEGMLTSADDLFSLSYEDGQRLSVGKLAPEAAREAIGWNKRYLDSFRRFPVPNELGLRHTYDDARPPARGDVTLRGVPGSSGIARGTVRVVRDLGQAKKVERGDILVTVFTDPGWTPLLSVVAGLVTETGGLLSHAAVIAREYGIPAILACAQATSRLVDGQRIEVNGATGEVRVLEGET